jgi:hypothetical protein
VIYHHIIIPFRQQQTSPLLTLSENNFGTSLIPEIKHFLVDVLGVRSMDDLEFVTEAVCFY